MLIYTSKLLSSFQKFKSSLYLLLQQSTERNILLLLCTLSPNIHQFEQRLYQLLLVYVVLFGLRSQSVMFPVPVHHEFQFLFVDGWSQYQGQLSLDHLVALLQDHLAETLHLTPFIHPHNLNRERRTSVSNLPISGSFLNASLASTCSSVYISTSPSIWQGCSTSTSLVRLNTSATFSGASVSQFLLVFSCFDIKFKQFWNSLTLIKMSATLTQRIQQSRQLALSKGTVIKLRKEDITKKKLLGSKFSYSWYQTPSKVGIQIPYVVDKKEDLKVKFSSDKLIIDFPIKNNKETYHLDLVLFREIVTVRSKVTHRLDSIQIVMEKKAQSESWPFLRRDGLGIPEAQPKQEISYPSSSKVRKNWDKIDREIDGDIMKNGQQFGQDPSMSFFKQIFAQGDEEKRKAMMKSFQTSGGTVLSTDWMDVAKKDYEGKDRPSPPKGQEWKKREQ